MQKKKCDGKNELEKIRNIISRYSPHGPVSHQMEEATVRYLYNPVPGLSQAKAALTQCYAKNTAWSFQQVYITLDSARLQERRQVESLNRHSIRAANVFEELQRLYGAPRRNYFQILLIPFIETLRDKFQQEEEKHRRLLLKLQPSWTHNLALFKTWERSW